MLVVQNGGKLAGAENEALAAALGGRAVFNPRKPEHGVTLQWRGHFLHLHTGERDAHVDGKTVSLGSVAAYVERSPGGQMRALVPLRFVAEALGGKVSFRPAAGGRPASVTVMLSP